MIENIQKKLLYSFGAELISFVRDKTINQSLKTIKGEIKDKISLKIADDLKDISDQQTKALEDLIIDSIDSALNNFLWMIEQSDRFDIVAQQDEKIYSLKDSSDGLSVDYWNFVDEFSNIKRLDS